MSDILSYIPSMNPRVQQPCLQFTYWSVVFMEQTVQGSQVILTASIIKYRYLTSLASVETCCPLCRLNLMESCGLS